MEMDEFLGVRDFAFFGIKTNNYCNLHCEHCSNLCHIPINRNHENIWRRGKYEISIEDLTAFCERFKGIGESSQHIILGGETTMMPVDKVEGIIGVLDNYNRKIVMQTTGYNLMGIDKKSLNKISEIRLADHSINSDHIKNCRGYLGSFYKGKLVVKYIKIHYDLDVAMGHIKNVGKVCNRWMRSLTLWGSVLYPCCPLPLLMMKNNDKRMQEELTLAGWSVHSNEFMETVKNWRNTIPPYIIEQCKNVCWFPHFRVGQGATKITLKKYDVIKKSRVYD